MWAFRKEIHKYGIGLLTDPPCDKGMDVVFLMDYTGSMGPVIEEAKNSVAAIVEAISAQSNPNNYRLALVISDEENKGITPNYNDSAGYTSLPEAQKDVETSGPTTNQYNTAMEVFDILNNEVSFTNQLNTINTEAFPLGFGVKGPEPLDIALDLIVNSDFVNPFRANKAKYILIFTDNLPGGNDDTYNATDDTVIANLTQDCIDKKIRVFVLGAGASKPVWQNLATNTGGNFNTSFDGSVIITQITATCEELESPVAVAGQDQTITLPTNSVTLNGSASFDTDGTITNYLWEVVSGPSGSNFSNSNGVTTNFNNLVVGTYIIRLTVTDNDGLQDTDFTTIIVEPVANTTPTVTGITFTDGDCCDNTSQSILWINSSILTSSGTGTLDFGNGQPNEVINLNFTGTFSSATTASFNSPVTVTGILDSTHNSRTGSVTLDSNGNASAVYSLDPGVNITVTITDRSSSLTDGIGLNTQINN